MKAKALGLPPSSILGLEYGSFEAYCLDEAVSYYGLTLENELDKASHKPSKEERKAMAARERVLSRYLDDEDEVEAKKTGFADPASMFD